MMEKDSKFPAWEVEGEQSVQSDDVGNQSVQTAWIAMRELFDRLARPFLQLRWKLTFSYIVVTVAALLVLEVFFLMAMAFNIARNTAIDPESVLKDLEKSYAQRLSGYLSQDPPDVEAMRAFLQPYQASTRNADPILFGNFLLRVYSTNILDVVFLTPEGVLIDALPHDFVERDAIGKPFDAVALPGLEGPMQAALAGETDYAKLYVFSENNRMVGAIPIFSLDDLYTSTDEIEPILDETRSGEIVGVIAFVQRLGFWEVWQFPEIAGQIGMSLLFITAFAALLGAFFGSITGKGLVARLSSIFQSAHAWSQGDFSEYVEDTSADELGRLAQGLNHMAAQLETLLEDRQHMSILKERNRLARDLHDSVKQQTFAASAQLAAAKAHFRLSAEQAEMHLLEAEKLLDEARQELTDLIHELRPVALQGRGLAAAVRQYVTDCNTQSDIQIDVRVHGERPLAVEVEQSLFRIVQGALSNVTRHSQATQAEVSLIYGVRTVTLTVVDNGCGFDLRVPHMGIGLRSMRERAEMVGGDLRIESEPGKGSRVSVCCVCEQESLPNPFGVLG